MIRVGVLSDTHSFIDAPMLKFFEACDQIWHAGDFGSMEIADILTKNKPLVGVHGNIDDYFIQKRYPMHQRFKCEEVDVWLTHVGGYPGHYAPPVYTDIHKKPPRLFICGHSHILKVMNDEKLGLLHINPGAAGISGQHLVRTAVRFIINGTEIKDLEYLEIKK
jgi:uncharacterized protein